jgi:O-antigen/teichoic acid export membrane protein
LGLCLATGLIISGGALAASPWATAHLYHDPSLAPLFKIYGCTVIVSAFREFYEPVLRLNDRFASVVVPQVAGGLLTLALLAMYFANTQTYDLKVVAGAFAVGGFVQTVPALLLALRLVWVSLSGIKLKQAARGLSGHRPQLLKCLFHSNLSDYMRFALNPGDVFLLGLVSSPAQVALYSLARQLTAPLAHLQTNAQTAVAPEVIWLAAERKFAQLRRLVRRFSLSASVLGFAAVAGGLLLGRTFVSLLSRPDYLAALPVFYVILVVASLMPAVAVLRPVSVSLDLLGWFNVGLLTSAAAVLAFAASGRLDAMNMAYAQLAGALVLRFICNVPVWVRLRALAGGEHQVMNDERWQAGDERGQGEARRFRGETVL